MCEGNLTTAQGLLQWTSISSRSRSKTPGDFMSQRLEFRSTHADYPSGFSDPLGVELASIPFSQWKHYWNVPILSHKDWKEDLVSCVKQTFYHLSPAPFTRYTTELSSEGREGHLLTCTFSKQLYNRWLEMWSGRLGPDSRVVVDCGIGWGKSGNGTPWVWMYCHVDSRIHSEGQFLSRGLVHTQCCSFQGWDSNLWMSFFIIGKRWVK